MTIVDWLGVWGSLASILGLLLTMYVAWAVRGIRDRYTRRAMLDSCLRRLRDAHRELQSSIANANIDAAMGAASRIKAVREQVHLHLPPEKSVEWNDEELNQLMQCDDRRKVISRARPVAALTQHWITQIELLIEEANWRRDDG